MQELPDGMYFENIIWNEACNCAHTILYKTLGKHIPTSSEEGTTMVFEKISGALGV